MKVKPPEVPMPGMEGGGNAKAVASGSFPSSAFRWARIAWNCSAGLVRSLHGLSVTKKNAL